uniref:Uncharacterized protein n=1 Tax=Panagrolaimus superbus TaxID=310955 RepID=A0A914XUV3_9BILA
MVKRITVAALALTGLLLLQSIIYLGLIAASFDKIKWINNCIEATVSSNSIYRKEHCSDFSVGRLFSFNGRISKYV